MGEEIMNVGILGCGVISRIYLRDMQRLFPGELAVKAVADVDPARAAKLAEEFDVPHAQTPEEMLADPEIGLVVNLTPPKLHTKLNRQSLEAGKHLFCEKPFALTLPEAEETLRLAESKGLSVGCAPDTFMGSAIQTCRKLIRDGWIGTPLYATANMMYSMVELWHPNPESFYQEGGGPVYDMGGYYITALVSLFGSVTRIQAVSATGYSERNVYVGPKAGQSFPVDTPTFYAVLLETSRKVIVTMNFSFDIWKSSLPLFEVYGTDGTLVVPDPNHHGGTPKVFRKEQRLAECFGGEDAGKGEYFTLPELSQNVGEYVRGLGVADMVRAIRLGRPCAANGKLALHVVDVMTGIMEAARTDTAYMPVTTYETEEERNGL